MGRDLRLPLGPVSPEIKAQLGEPEKVFVAITDGLDVHAPMWLIGVGKVGSEKRGTKVRIWVTPGGTLLTNVATWHGPEPGDADEWEGESSRGQFHETPQGALDWLMSDDNGKLGGASKAAWKAACEKFPPMRGMNARHID